MFALAECSKETPFVGLGALLLALLVVPASAQQQKPSGAEVWSSNCGRCHRVRAVDAYNASQWESVVTHMALTARLTPDETQAVREFLVGAAQARETAASGAASASRQREPLRLASRGTAGIVLVDSRCCDPDVGRAIFKAQCVACHGPGGKGDGPAAPALNPRPANLADAARMEKLSDDSLVQIVTAGRLTMPGYGRTLTPEQVSEVVAYVRSLKP